MRGLRGHRLAVLLSLPTVLLTVLAVFGIFSQIRVVGQADAAADDVELVLATQELIHSLQRERGLTVGLLSGTTEYRPQLDTQRSNADETRAALSRLLAGRDEGTTRAVRAAMNALANLGSERESVDGGQVDRATVFDYYTARIKTLNNATHEVDSGQDDRDLRRNMQALLVLGDAKESTGQERAHLNGVFADGSFKRNEDYVTYNEIRATRLDALAQFSRLVSTKRMKALDSALRSPEAATVDAYEKRALAGARGQQLKLSPQQWWDAMTAVIDDMREVQQDVGEDVQERAGTIKRQAVLQLAIYASGAALTLALALLLWLYTLRSIMRPLETLTREAHEAAERKLPATVARIQAAEDPNAVALDTSPSRLSRRKDEFAEVARALDHLQATATRLAIEQAVMRRNTAESLANLGRRNQNLVRRQLGFISTLEREESDPNTLSNLFKLDHLATRMRRNAESLLVLVGKQSPRRWSESVAVGDVLRSAFAEVEDYQRVVLRRVDDARVKGVAAAEVSHLLAELVENALNCSPPDQEVEIQAHATESEYHIAIIDQGIGMTAEAMATANARMRGEQTFLVAPTRDLGHYVVGQLVERLGVRVWLHESPLSGVTARVVLPADLLDTPKMMPPITPPAPPPARPHGADDTNAMPTTATSVAVATFPEVQTENGAGATCATTRNGLVKRQPRQHLPRRPDRKARSEVPPKAPRRSPDEVQSMLNSFRAGFLQGERSTPTTPGSDDEEA
jgi:anti-sigma regulatory factor (Ser/Thr protein kinase)